MPHFYSLVLLWIAIGLITFLLLVRLDIRAPYGRHSRTDWGRMIDNRWGWFWMELPALLIMPLLSWLGPSEKSNLLYLLTGLWVLHYINRTLIFPFRLKTQGKKMPLVIVCSALFFNTVNGLINGYYLGYLASRDSTILSWNVGLGSLFFLGGMYINRRADQKLIALRNHGSGYQIPRGWWFDYISCPNHFGEIIEWTGFALAAWSLPALSFAIWTFCNLVPRAINHHAWYREHFPDYPAERKAVFPFLW